MCLYSARERGGPGTQLLPHTRYVLLQFAGIDQEAHSLSNHIRRTTA
jgi:hypothetical protein